MPNESDPIAKPPAPSPATRSETAAAKPSTAQRRAKPGPPKEKINIRLSPEVLKAFRATGPGWQARMDAALREALEAGWLDSGQE